MKAQEAMWTGQFGDAYASRNDGAALIAANTALFSRILSRITVRNAIEFGANVGLNLEALRRLIPQARLSALEINPTTLPQLQSRAHEVMIGSMLDFQDERQWELAFTKGVLIHIAPDDLPTAYDVLYRASSRYICVAEYYSPAPVMIPYRGQADRLWKRDFAGEMLDRYPDLRLLDYGFAYHRGPFSQDDINWFTLEKMS